MDGLTAIEIIESSKKTHENWLDYFVKNPQALAWKEHENVGDIEHHRKCIKDYEQVIKEFKQLEAQLNELTDQLKDVTAVAGILQEANVLLKAENEKLQNAIEGVK